MALTGNLGSNLAVKFGFIQTYIAGGAIYRGATVVLRLATADDKVYAAVDDTADVYKQLVVGWAMEETTADGDTIRIRADGKMKRDFPSMPASVIGRLACIKDDESVQLWSAGSTCKAVVGRITEKPSSTTVYVNFLDRPVRLATSLTD
ncbi:hypothetical protein LCGC14_1930000 [marine sediment metagenome]|uniref:Uncharacterized protein n=1 Tax=marine sediment metagenome TaxID=412755 RepID=A0A0F9FNU4_9ZZZZ